MKTKTGKGNDGIVLFLHHFLIQHQEHPPTRCLVSYHSDATKDESFCIIIHFLMYHILI